MDVLVYFKFRVLFVKYVIYCVKLTLKFNFRIVIMLKVCIFALSKQISFRINLVFKVFL
jgi:hypothetical protein